ncbi:hypothetical protein U1Q18_049629 [Sarracenia purpurea var. burkii]
MDALGKEPTFATTPEKESTFTTPDLRGDLELVCRSKAEEPPSGVRDLAQGTDKGDVGCAPVFSDLSERIFSSSDGVGEKLEEEDEGKVEENAGVSSLSAGGPKMMDTEINGDKPKPSLEGKMVVTEVGEDSSEQSDSGEEGSNSAEGSCSESDSSESEIGDAELNAEGAELGEVLERNKDKTVLGTRPDCLGAGGKSTPQQLLHPRAIVSGGDKQNQPYEDWLGLYDLRDLRKVATSSRSSFSSSSGGSKLSDEANVQQEVENTDRSSDDGEASSLDESFSVQEDQVTKTEVCAFKATASSKNIRIISSDSLMSSPGNYVVNVDVEMISSLASMEFQTVASSAKSDHAIQVLDGSPEPSPSVKVDEAEAVCVAGVNAIDPRK